MHVVGARVRANYHTNYHVFILGDDFAM